MAKPTLDAHPSVTIAHCPENGKLLMAVYDAGYKQVSYRFSANNIGGNPSPEDGSPINVLFKEINEEYNPNHGEKTQFGETVLWAPREDISLIRDRLIDRVVPYQDFLVNAVQFPNDNTTATYTAIFSAFYSEISEEAIETAESNLRRVRRLSPEGLTGVFTLDELANDLMKGNLSTAHATPPILNHFFNTNIIPYPSELKAEPIGQVRDAFRDYLSDFSYNEKIARATGLLR